MSKPPFAASQAPAIALMIVNNKPSPDKTNPAIAIPFFEELRPKNPKTKPTIANGPPQIGNSQEQRLMIPNTSDAIARPDLSLVGVEGAG